MVEDLSAEDESAFCIVSRAGTQENNVVVLCDSEEAGVDRTGLGGLCSSGFTELAGFTGLKIANLNCVIRNFLESSLFCLYCCGWHVVDRRVMAIGLDHGEDLHAVVAALVVGELVVEAGLPDRARVRVRGLDQFEASVRVVQVRVFVFVKEVLVEELVELAEHCGAGHVVAEDDRVEVGKICFVIVV